MELGQFMTPLLVVSVLLSTGCTIVLKDHSPMNAALRHVNMASCGTTAGEGQPDEVVLTPGMKLRLTYADVLAKDNDVFPAVSSFEWIAPRRPAPGASFAESYEPKDRFFFRYLLSVMHPDTGDALLEPLSVLKSAAVVAADGAATNQDLAFYNHFLERTLVKAFGSPRGVSVSFTTTRKATPACSAEWLAEQWTQPTKDDDEEVGWQTLRVRHVVSGNGSNGIDLSGWNWTDPLFRNKPGLRANLESDKVSRNSLYKGSIRKPLGLIEVEIPIRVDLSATSMYVPFVWSVRRLEERLGVTIASIRRSADLLPPSLEFEEGKKKKVRVVAMTTVQGRDRHVTLCFEPGARGCASAHRRKMLIPTNRKAQILLSPGDVISTVKNAEIATDSPDVR